MVRILTIADIEDRIREAADTLWRLPDETRQQLRSGERGSWPATVRDWLAYGADKARLSRALPSGDAIDRMEEVIGWIAWLASADEREAKIVWWQLGKRMRTTDIARRLGLSRDTVERDRKAGLQRLVGRIRAQSQAA